MESISIHSETVKGKPKRRIEPVEARHSNGKTESGGAFEPVLSSGNVISRAPGRQSQRPKQDQVAAHTQEISLRQEASGGDRHHSARIISLRPGVNPVQCERVKSLRSGLQQDVVMDCDKSKHVSEIKSRVSSGCVKTITEHKTRNTKHRSHKGERRSKRRVRSRTQVICSCPKPPTTDDFGAEPSEEVSDASVQTAPIVDQGTEEIDRQVTGATDVRPGYTLDNVRLTEMELATCKRLDSLAKNRQQGRASGRRASATFAKYQGATTTSAQRQEPHEVETTSQLTKVTPEPLDLGGESEDLQECSGDRAGRLTYRCDESEAEKNATDIEWRKTSIEPETNQITKVNCLPKSNGSLSAAEAADQRASEDSSRLLECILNPMQMLISPRPQSRTSGDRRNRSCRGDESKVIALAETLCAYNNRSTESVRISNHSETTAKSKPKSWLVSDEDSHHHPTRYDNYRPQSSACFHDDSSSVAMATKYSSSSSCHNSSSYYDSCSQTSLDDTSDTTSAAAAATRGPETRGFETMGGATSGIDAKIKNSLNDTYVTVKSPDATSSAPQTNDPDGSSSVPPTVIDTADAAPDRRHRRVLVAVKTPLFKGIQSNDRAGNTKEVSQSKTKENNSSDVKRRHQKISSRRNNGCSPSAQEGQPNSLRPATTVIPAVSTRNVASPLKSHTNRISGPVSPMKNVPASDHRATRTPPRLPSAKLSGRSEATSPCFSKNTGAGKAAGSSTKSSPTKTSEWRLSMRPPEQDKESKCAPIRSVHRPAAAVDRDRLGARQCAASPLRSGHTLEDSYAQLQKERSIPVEFKLKEVSREVDDNDKEKKPVAGAASPNGSVAKYCAKIHCISQDNNSMSTDNIARTAAPASPVFRIASAKTHACTSKKLEVVSTKTLEKNLLRKSLKEVERLQGFDQRSDSGAKISTDKTVSNQDERGQSPLKSPGYVVGQEKKSFKLPTPRTFLVSSEQSDPNQRQSLKITRRKKAANEVQSSTTRTFLVGQSCVQKIQTRYPRNFNAAGHKLRRIRSLQNTIHCLKRARSQQLSRANLEQSSGMSGKSNSTQDEHSSPERHQSHSSPKIDICGGNPVATPHSEHHQQGRHSGKIPPGQNTPAKSHSNSPVQLQQFCSTPIMGSTCSRSPLFYSPIPSLPPAKLPEAKKNRSELACRSGNYSLNTSYTIPCSPKKPSSCLLLKPLSRFTSALDSNGQSAKRVVSDGWKKDTTKDKGVPVAPESPTKLRNSVLAIKEKLTGSSSQVNDRKKQNSRFNAKDMTEAVDSSTRVKLRTDKSSAPSFNCIFYKNHSRPVDKSRLPNGQQSKIPLASCQPFHILPAGTNVRSFRLRVHYDDIPTRSFRYSKFHRKIIENKVPACIRQLPKLMLGKSRVKDKAKPRVKAFY